MFQCGRPKELNHSWAVEWWVGSSSQISGSEDAEAFISTFCTASTVGTVISADPE